MRVQLHGRAPSDQRAQLRGATVTSQSPEARAKAERRAKLKTSSSISQRSTSGGLAASASDGGLEEVRAVVTSSQ